NETNLPPTAIATATPLNGDAPLNVNFTGNSSVDDNGIVSYLWDFGDGTTSNAINPTHTYISSGVFNASLTVTDIEGLVSTDFVSINVTAQNTEGVIGYTLIDSSTNSELLELSDGLQIDANLTDGVLLNIRANTNPPIVGSVRLQLTGALTRSSTENVAPYALYGDLGGNYLGTNFPSGNYTLSATPYSGSNLSGIEGETVTINFSIVDSGSTLRVAPLNALKIDMHPNPVSEVAHVGISENQSKIAEISIYDVAGRRVKTIKNKDLKWENGDVLLSVQEFEDGFYFVVAVTESLDIVQTRMVVKTK
ncbi:PKD domain-containing protein, partial [Muricauda sp. 2012CJ35-5]